MNNRLAKPVRHFLELIFLWALFFLPLLFHHILDGAYVFGLAGFGEADYHVFLFSLFCSFLVMGLLLISRISPGKLSFLMLSYIFFGIWFYLFVIKKTIPVYREIRGEAIPGLLPNRILVPTMALLFRTFLLYLVPFLGGLFAVRRGFRWWKFFAGALASYMILMGLCYLDILPFKKLFSLQTLSLLILYTAMLLLPLQRRALEKLCGFSLKPAPEEKKLSVRKAFIAILGYSAIVLIILVLFFFAIHEYYYHNTVKSIQGPGPEPLHRSAALKNAYPVFEEMFTFKGSPDISSRMDEIIPGYEQIIDPDFSGNPADIWEGVDIKAFNWEIQRLNPYMEVLEKAENADYCVYYNEEKRVAPYFRNFRDAAAALSLRSLYSMKMNRPHDAVNDIETILHTAWLLNSDGGVVTHMIGANLRKIGLNTALQYYLKFRDDPERLSLLKKMLTENEHKIRLNFDVQNIIRNEPGMKRFVPMYEIITPGISKAYVKYYVPWVWYDQLILAMALDEYNNEYGAYPESLRDLAPEYLDEIPQDPYNGEFYDYEIREGDISIQCAYLSRKGNKDEQGSIVITGFQ